MPKVKGHMRRRTYQCRECLGDVKEYPGNVLNAADLVCPACQEKRELADQIRTVRAGDRIVATNQNSSIIVSVIEVKEVQVRCDTGILFSKETGISTNLPVPLTIGCVQRAKG